MAHNYKTLTISQFKTLFPNEYNKKNITPFLYKVKQKKMFLSYIKRYPFSLTTILIIAYFSFFHPPSLNVPAFQGIDKLAHFCMYAGLSGVLWIEFLFNHKKGLVNMRHAITGAVICPILLGAIIEFMQEYFTKHRQGDYLDFMANTCGVLMATCIAWYIFRPIILKRK